MTRDRTAPDRSSRRRFLSQAGRMAAAAGVVAGFPTIVPARVFGQFSPANRINVGAIGTGRISRARSARHLEVRHGAHRRRVRRRQPARRRREEARRGEHRPPRQLARGDLHAPAAHCADRDRPPFLLDLSAAPHGDEAWPYAALGSAARAVSRRRRGERDAVEAPAAPLCNLTGMSPCLHAERS